jgi:phosphoribosylaminoimidazolecarboxamide formyltransferase/IMP cyclohydrolase
VELISEFSEPACVIIKHANPCGVATAKTLVKAYEKALACDPVSAYGSIISFNREIDKETAETLAKLWRQILPP